MARCVKIIEKARLTEMWRLNAFDISWEKRLIYLNTEAPLIICVSEHQYPGKLFCIFGDFLRTSYGDCIMKDDCFVIKTRNSIYKFKILDIKDN